MAQVTPSGSSTPLLPSGQPMDPHSRPVQLGNSPTNPLHPSTKRPVPKFGDLGNCWSSFDRATDDYDRDILDVLKTNMDNLLIFAALFSAVNSAFIALSVPMLSADSGDETNRLLRLLVRGLDNSTLTQDDLASQPSSPSKGGIRINQLFSVSLTCSMLAAFGALVGQQWVAAYKRRPVGGFEEERRERQRRLLGAKRWHLERVLELFLPLLLQVSLIVFIVGMVEYLRSLSPPVALPNAILSWFGAAFFILSILFSLSDPHCPFKTPFSELADFFIRRSLTWFSDHNRIRIDAPRRYTSEWAKISLKAKGYAGHWFLRRWPDEILEGHSVRRILVTSADAKTLHDMALNIPLIRNHRSLDAIYEDNVAITHLYQLYKIHSVQSSADAGVFGAAICHLVLAAKQQHPERINHLLQDHELRIILSAAHNHISSPDNPTSLVPSSTVTVALAYLLSELGSSVASLSRHDVQHQYVDFLHTSIQTTTTPDLPIACLAWILVSSPSLTPDPDKRRNAREAIGLGESPPNRLQSGTGLFSYAAEAHHKFHKPSSDNVHRISDEVLVCIAQAFETQSTPTEASRPIVSHIIKGLTEVLDAKTEVRRVSRLGVIVDALHPLLTDDDVGLAAAKLMLAVLSRTKPPKVPLETLRTLEGHAANDEEIRTRLQAYSGRSQDPPLPQGASLVSP